MDKYNKYYQEGVEAYLNGLKERPPYSTIDKTYPWYDGYRETQKAKMEEKYKISKLQEEIRELVKKYGLILEYSDEYSDPYIETPEGYVTKIC